MAPGHQVEAFLHSVTSQKAFILINTAVRASDLSLFLCLICQTEHVTWCCLCVSCHGMRRVMKYGFFTTCKNCVVTVQAALGSLGASRLKVEACEWKNVYGDTYKLAEYLGHKEAENIGHVPYLDLCCRCSKTWKTPRNPIFIPLIISSVHTHPMCCYEDCERNCKKKDEFTTQEAPLLYLIIYI